jgi:hypothetical protein
MNKMTTKTASFKTVLARSDGSDVSVEVTYEYQMAQRGARDSWFGVAGAGPPLESDESETVDIVGVTDVDDSDVELTHAEESHLTLEALEHVRKKKDNTKFEQFYRIWEDRQLFGGK